MGMLGERTDILEQTEAKARKISEESRRFDQSTKKLVWTYWIRNNLIWIVLALTVGIVVFLIF